MAADLRQPARIACPAAMATVQPLSSQSGLVQWLQLEDRVTRRQFTECFHRRPLGYWEEALHLACESIDIGFEDRRAHAGGKFAHRIGAAADRAGQREL